MSANKTLKTFCIKEGSLDFLVVILSFLFQRGLFLNHLLSKLRVDHLIF